MSHTGEYGARPHLQKDLSASGPQFVQAINPEDGLGNLTVQAFEPAGFTRKVGAGIEIGQHHHGGVDRFVGVAGYFGLTQNRCQGAGRIPQRGMVEGATHIETHCPQTALAGQTLAGIDSLDRAGKNRLFLSVVVGQCRPWHLMGQSGSLIARCQHGQHGTGPGLGFFVHEAGAAGQERIPGGGGQQARRCQGGPLAQAMASSENVAAGTHPKAGQHLGGSTAQRGHAHLTSAGVA